MGNKSPKRQRSQPPPEALKRSCFTPLPSARHILLINLRSTENYITGQHFIMSLDEAPAYHALSYTWGIPTQRDLELRMQAPDVPVTENLTSALYFLSSISPGTYWIDALCINQRDDAEKSSQVALMRDIYSAAKVVVVFLGSKSDESTMACKLIGNLAELIQNGTMDLEGAAVERSHSVAKKYPFEDSKLQELGLPSTAAQDWIALAGLLSNPYFARVWVLQELVMANAPIVVFCGSFQLLWAALEMTQRVLLATGWNFELKRLAAERGRQLDMQALEFLPVATTLQCAPSKKLGLLMLLDMSRFLLATDPRDNIIALLGMVTEADDMGVSTVLRPDYGKSVQQVYTEVTGASLRMGNLDLLSSVEIKLFRGIEKLPSWVPDYSATSHNGTFAMGYAAGGNSLVSANWTPGSDELRVKAFVADTVNVISRPFNGFDYEKDLLELFGIVARSFGSEGNSELEWLSLLAEGRSERHLEAFWQTLVGAGNTARGDNPMPPNMRSHFATFMAQLFANLVTYEDEEAQQRLNATCCRESLHMGDPSLFTSECLDKLMGNRFFITQNERMGLATMDLEPGDQVMDFSGASPIYIVREREGYHQYIGDGYVYGLMSGEAVSGQDSIFSEIVLR